jgi:PEP-CTERM motif
MIYKNVVAAAAATLLACAAPSFAADQSVALVGGEASFIGSSPVLAGGDDVISFTGLAAGTYDFILTISAQNIAGLTGDFNGTPISTFAMGPVTFGGLISSGNAPFTLTLFGTAGKKALYSGELTTTPVPEPSTYALMLAGLAAMGFVARRRSAAQR